VIDWSERNPNVEAEAEAEAEEVAVGARQPDRSVKAIL
jgi:hypothetical protein